MGELFQPWHLIIILIFSALVIVPFWQIFKKAGLTGALAILMVIPLANLIMLYVLAFSRWKTPGTRNL
jgi:Zn-dependent protease with chaperone function